MSLARKIFGIGAWTGVSRITGFIRDVLIGHYLGAGRLSDIFLTAFKLPNLFRDLLGEGAMASVFIPMFSRENRNSNFASNAFSWLMLVLLIITLLIEVFMPGVIFAIAPGFDAEKLALSVDIARIMFFYCLLICAVSFMSAILNAFSDFILAAAIPILLNVFLIIGAVTFKTNLYAQAMVVLVSGVVQLFILARRLKKRRFGLRLVRPRSTPLIRQIAKRMGWGLLGTGFYQLNVFVGVLLASFQSGAVSYLYYSDRLVQLPFSIVGLAAGTVILTKISDAISAKKNNAVFRYQNAAMRTSLMLVLPSVVGMFVLAEPIVQFLFEHGGAWSHAATVAVAAVIMIQVMALPFMTTSQIYMKTLYAAHDMRTPVKISAFALSISTIIMLSTVTAMGYLCVPVGTVVGGIVRNILLKRACLRRKLYQTNNGTIKAIACFSILSLLMGAGLWVVKSYIVSVVSLIFVLVFAAIIYLPLAFLCDKIIKR